MSEERLRCCVVVHVRIEKRELVAARRLLLLRASRHCLSSKVKRPTEPWRRPGRTPSRPTLLLPPAPIGDPLVVASLVQRELPPPEYPHTAYPSAPSPGHLFHDSEDRCDITFLVGPEEWRFPAHSFILGKEKAALRQFLRQGGGGGPSEAPPLVLRLPDMQPDLFNQVLRYIYTGQVSLCSVEGALQLLGPCRVYRLPDLAARCLSFLSRRVSAEDALTAIAHLLRHEEEQEEEDEEQPEEEEEEPSVAAECELQNRRNALLAKCFSLVDAHADAVLRGDAFETLDRGALTALLQRDTLAVSSEALVFEALMRWASRACKRQGRALTPDNKRAVLGPALFLVRYLAMTPEEFLRGPVAQGVLPPDDKALLLARLNGAPGALPERWRPWNVEPRRRPAGPSPEPCPSEPPAKQPRKKKSMSKKLLSGVGDLVICVIQLLD